MTGFVAYLRRPEIRRQPARLLLRRLRFEVARLLTPRSLNRERVVSVDGLFKMRVLLNDTIEQSIYLFGAHERTTLSFFRGIVRPGMIVVDVGAHSGQFALCAAVLAGPKGQVIAFEPNPVARERLVRNQRLNDLTTLLVRAEAAAHEPGHATLFFPAWAGGNSGIATLVPQPNPERIVDVEMVRLDDALSRLPRIDVIKIDVEGLERQVIEGGMETIARFTPVIVFELNDLDAANRSPTIDLLKSLGYDLFGMIPTSDRSGSVRLQDISAGQSPAVYRENWQALNLVAVHRNHSADTIGRL